MYFLAVPPKGYPAAGLFSMQLKLFKTLWGHTGSVHDAISQCAAIGWAGIEGPAPVDPNERKAFATALSDAGLEYVAEICTAGGYVPRRDATIAEHLDTLKELAERSAECAPLFITTMAGCDAWSLNESVDFFSASIEIAAEVGLPICFEIHRSRSMFNPWIARDILTRIPEMRITCDFSHWCVVCERLIDTEMPIIELCAKRAGHIHARVGYDQGAQVPDPAAPEYRAALEAHERWWTMIWEEQARRNVPYSTMTPEFGPDGYLQTLPYTGMPVADLLAVNRWIGERQRQRFASWHKTA